jgi:ligand-binding sensor domain-containing protein
LFNFGDGVEITDIAFAKDTDDLWLVGWKCGLTKFNKKNFTWEKYKLENSNNTADEFINDTYSILIDSDNNLWVGTWGQGVYNFDKEKQVAAKMDIAPGYAKDFSINYDIILDIYEDSDKNIWLGIDGAGVAYIGGKKYFNGISVENDQNCGLKNFHIRGIHETNDGYLWVGTKGGGVYRSQDKQNFELITNLVKTRESLLIKFIYQYSDSLLWVGTAERLLQLDISKKYLVLVPVDNPLIREMKKVTSALRIGEDLIIGTQEDGIYILYDNINGEQVRKHITSKNNPILKSNRITFIKKDIEEKIWIGTYNGLYLFDRSSKSVINPSFTEGEMLSSDIVECWEQTFDGAIWIGTPNGQICCFFDVLFQIVQFNTVILKKLDEFIISQSYSSRRSSSQTSAVMGIMPEQWSFIHIFALQ